MSALRPLLFATMAVGCTTKPASVGAPPDAPAASAKSPSANVAPGAARKLHLLFTGNVHGEIEPCG